MPTSDNQLFRAGVVIGTHGLRGDLKVRPETSGATGLVNASRVFLRSTDGTEKAFEPQRVAVHKGNYLLRFKGLGHIDQVEGFVGDEVWMLLEDLAELDDGENYWHQLEGLEVVDVELGSLGRLESMFTTPAHDVYVVNGPYGEVMIPAVEAFVLAIDLDQGLMEVELPEGLVTKSDDL